ncbi:hypothetical protein [Flavobacterium sp.]
MKKIILLCMLFVFSNTIFAQTDRNIQSARDQVAISKASAAKKKAAQAKVEAAKAKEEAAKATRLKKDGTPDKRYKSKSAVKLKKDGTPDKRYKSNNASATGAARSAEGKARAAANKERSTGSMTAAQQKEDMRETAASRAAEKKTYDKITGTYKGKRVYTGPRGGRYYINKNGNKTYIDKND